MKTVYLTLLFLISAAAFGQKMPSDYFNEAYEYFEEEEFDKALKGFQYIVDNHPRNELYPRAFYNIGYIHFIQKNYDKAIPVFKAIIESNFNEKENLGGGIMADPYTNYKNRASRILSTIYYDKEMFDTALHYLTLSDTAYPYLHFCGNEYAENDVYMALRYADIYQKLKQPDKAVEKLLPTVFTYLADNSEVIAELKKLLKNKKGLKKELDNALTKIYSKEIVGEKYTYTRYYFKFLNVEIAIPYDKTVAAKYIKQTAFYKMIKQL